MESGSFFLYLGCGFMAFVLGWVLAPRGLSVCCLSVAMRGYWFSVLFPILDMYFFQQFVPFRSL